MASGRVSKTPTKRKNVKVESTGSDSSVFGDVQATTGQSFAFDDLHFDQGGFDGSMVDEWHNGLA